MDTTCIYVHAVSYKDILLQYIKLMQLGEEKVRLQQRAGEGCKVICTGT